MGDELVSYSTWELTLPELPARSRLYHLRPLGVGTPLVESLTSYLIRLAQAHCVTLRQLLIQEIAPTLDELAFSSKDSPPSLTGSWFKISYTVHGLDHFARNFVPALQRLTCRSQLQYLTLLTWAHVLPNRGLLRLTRAWCPACYQNQIESGRPIYDPLLFSLRIVAICPVHHQYLISCCPHPGCRCPIPFLVGRIQPGLCPHCKRSLAVVDKHELQTPTQEDLLWQNWVGLAMGGMLAGAPTVLVPPTKERVAISLSAYATQLTGGSIIQLARKLDLPEQTLRCWKDGTRLPHLTSLVQLSYLLGTSPFDFLTQDPLVINPTPFTFLDDNPFLRASRRTVARLKPPQVQAALEAALTEEPPPSLTQMIRRLEYDFPSFLRRQFPELCWAISERYRSFRQGTVPKSSSIRGITKKDQSDE